MKKLRPSDAIIIRQFAAGMSREEIAASLHVTINTLDSKVCRIKRYLGAKTLCQMVGNYLKLRLCELFNEDLVNNL